MINDFSDYSLLAHNTFGMDVRAKRFIEYATVAELQEVLTRLYASGDTARMLCIGSGSNLLFAGDYAGVVLHSRIGGLEVVGETDDEVWVRVGAGEVWDDFVACCVERGWYGAENLSAIPGEVGASAVQNIGAYGAEVKDLIVKVEAVEVETSAAISFTNEACGYAYRQSNFKHVWRGRYVITHVTYRLGKRPAFRIDYGNLRAVLGDRPLTLQAVRQAVCEVREAKLPDPRVQGNAGSFFMNPVVPRAKFEALQSVYPDMPYYEVDATSVKIPAGWMIDRCGWKGRAIGRAGVHDKQALVLVNLGGATGAEVMHLAEAVCRDVKQQFGIDIYPEVNYIS